MGDIAITDVNSKSSQECAAARAEFEEKVQEILNDAELEVQQLNNDRDQINREVTQTLELEKIRISTDALSYSREKQLELVTKQAENKAKAKQVVANAEAEAAEVLAARRKHAQDFARLDVYEALAKNKDLRIASGSEIQA